MPLPGINTTPKQGDCLPLSAYWLVFAFERNPSVGNSLCRKQNLIIDTLCMITIEVALSARTRHG